MTHHGFYESQLIRNDDNGAIYIVLDKYLRHIPNPDTLNATFRTWHVDQHIRTPQLNDAEGYFTEGRPLPDGALTFAVEGSPHIYLLDSDGHKFVKRHITSPAAMDKYKFKWPEGPKIPAIIADAVPDGNPISV